MNIKELSSLCNTSPQSIRNWCKRNNIPITKTSTSRASYEITSETEKRIIEYYKGNPQKQPEKEKQEEKERKAQQEQEKQEEKERKAQQEQEKQEEKERKVQQEQEKQAKNEELISYLTTELEQKQKQIDELTSLLHKTQDSLNNAQELVQNEQRLHLLAVSEKNELEAKLQLAVSQLEETQTNVHKGIFAKLFKRKSID